MKEAIRRRTIRNFKSSVFLQFDLGRQHLYYV